MAESHEEEVLGKAYDARIMRRLLRYLRPYRLQAVISLVAILLKACLDVAGPYLTKIALDTYFDKQHLRSSALDRYLTPHIARRLRRMRRRA